MIRNISEKRRVVCDWFESSRFPKKVERFRREDSCRARRLVIHLNGSSTRQAQLQPRQKTVRERAASSYDVRGLCSLLVPSTYSRVLVFSSLKGEKEEGLRARVLRHSTEHIADIVKASLLSRFARRVVIKTPCRSYVQNVQNSCRFSRRKSISLFFFFFPLYYSTILSSMIKYKIHFTFQLKTQINVITKRIFSPLFYFPNTIKSNINFLYIYFITNNKQAYPNG